MTLGRASCNFEILPQTGSLLPATSLCSLDLCHIAIHQLPAAIHLAIILTFLNPAYQHQITSILLAILPPIHKSIITMAQTLTCPYGTLTPCLCSLVHTPQLKNKMSPIHCHDRSFTIPCHDRHHHPRYHSHKRCPQIGCCGRSLTIPHHGLHHFSSVLWP